MASVRGARPGDNRIYARLWMLRSRGLSGLLTTANYKLLYLLAHGLSRERRIILYYPQKPWFGHTLYKVAHLLGCRLTSDLAVHNPAVIVSYEDTTRNSSGSRLESLCASSRVLNGSCTDISKERVEEVFSAVFGRTTFVDPRSHHGWCVMKSNENALHDGQLVECPCEPVDDYVYQRTIDNELGGGLTRDLRVPLMGTSVPFVYHKDRSLRSRFGSPVIHAQIVPTSAVFSAEEIDLIRRFAQQMGLDYGELDILRDNGDGQIYIVDANKTPMGPAPGLSRWNRIRAVLTLSRTFKEAFLSGDGPRPGVA
jgi:hypothetical protein